MWSIGDARGIGSLGRLARSFEHELVETRRRVLAGGSERLHHHQRSSESVGLESGVSERPVLLDPLGRLHPVEDVLALGLGPLLVEGDGTERELIPDVRRAEWVRHHPCNA
jgi:hypothetical protein